LYVVTKVTLRETDCCSSGSADPWTTRY